MTLPRLSGEFRLYGDPALSFTPSGLATLTQRLVAADQKKDDAGQYQDTETLWINLVLWRDVAEHFANSFKDKDLVTVTNVKPHVRTFEKKDGTKGQSFDLKYDFESSVGPSLRFRTTPHSDQAQHQQAQPGQWGGQQQQPAQNPGQWGNQPPQGYPAQGQPQAQPGGYPQQGQPQGQPPQQPYQQPQQQPQQPYQQPQQQPGQWPGSEI